MSVILLCGASGCGEPPGPPHENYHNCAQDLVYSHTEADWYYWDLHIEHDEPRTCPVDIDYPQQYVSAGGTVWERSGLVFVTAYIKVYNSDDELKASTFNNFQYDEASQDYYAQMSTSYSAATGGSLYRDRMRYEMTPSPNPWAHLWISYADCPLCW